MTDIISDDRLAEIRAGLEGVPAGPWAYRPAEHDDWGVVRYRADDGDRWWHLLQARAPYTDEEDLSAHRHARTDPWGALAKHISRLDPQTISALLARLDKAEAERIPEGWALVPVVPSDDLLKSMAIRYDHGLGCPGYYDQPIFGAENVGHERRLQSTLTTMRQLHEEVVGTGFYRAPRVGSGSQIADANPKNIPPHD